MPFLFFPIFSYLGFLAGVKQIKSAPDEEQKFSVGIAGKNEDMMR